MKRWEFKSGLKKFDKLNKVSKWLIAVVFLAVMLIILNLWIQLVDKSYWGMILIFFIVPVIQFLVTPLFTLLNLYNYYSPMLLSFGNNKRVLNLHNGSSFDYLLEMRNIKPGKNWERKMLLFYLQGLVNIIKQVEQNKLPGSIIIRGSSYFICRKTASRLNFETRETPLPEKINLALNYIDLVWTFSLSKGKIVFPNLGNIKTVVTTGDKLLQSKSKLITLVKYLDQPGRR